MNSKSSNKATPPDPDCLEVSLIGPGFGEAVLIHVGDGKWLAIDSCAGEVKGSCASLDYLNEIGANVSDNLLAIFISHWDDDHIKGLSKLVGAASAAQVVSSAAIWQGDFVKLVRMVYGDATRRKSTGVDEIAEIYEIVRARGGDIFNAVEQRQLYFDGLSSPLTHGLPIEVRTLSPNDPDFNEFIGWIGTQIPEVGKTKGRFPKRKRNNLSVVVSVRIGDDALLFGGDMEETGDPARGWSRIVASRGGAPWDRASLYKVAHHGSKTGHHDGVWQDMLADDPTVALAPWINGAGLVPDAEERDAIAAATPHAFSTATQRFKPQPLRGRSTRSKISEFVENFQSAELESGHVRFRRKVGSPAGAWNVELFGQAIPLSEWPKTTAQPKQGPSKAREARSRRARLGKLRNLD